MKLDKVIFVPTLVCSFTDEELALMLLCAEHHYDGVCQSCAGTDGFLTKQKQLRKSWPERGYEDFNFRTLDTICKCLEMGIHLPDKDQAAKSVTLHLQVKNILQTANDLTPEPVEPGSRIANGAFKVGDRVQLNALGRNSKVHLMIRNPDRHGTVVGFGDYGKMIRVKLDGNVCGDAQNPRYWEKSSLPPLSTPEPELHNFKVGDRVKFNEKAVKAYVGPKDAAVRCGTVIGTSSGKGYVRVQLDGTKKTSAASYHPSFLELTPVS